MHTHTHMDTHAHGHGHIHIDTNTHTPMDTHTHTHAWTHTHTQVVNGLMEREDWETAIKTPLGVLPLGSGNALCASILHEAKLVLSTGNVCYSFTELDLEGVQEHSGPHFFSIKAFIFLCCKTSWEALPNFLS